MAKKKAGLKRDYKISVIIDSSKSNNIYSFHSFKINFLIFLMIIFKLNSLFLLVIETDKEPIILYVGKETINSLNNKSKKWQALASQLYENNNLKCNIKDSYSLFLN